MIQTSDALKAIDQVGIDQVSKVCGADITPLHQGTQTRIFNRILYKKLKSPSVMHILSAYNEDLLKMFLNCNRSCDFDVQYK